jgi:hypothetical protein
LGLLKNEERFTGSIDAIGPAAVLNDLDRIAKEMPDRALTPPGILVAMTNEK